MRPLILTETVKIRVTPEMKARWQAAAGEHQTLSGFVQACVEKELSPPLYRNQEVVEPEVHVPNAPSVPLPESPYVPGVVPPERVTSRREMLATPPEKPTRETPRAAAPQPDPPAPKNVGVVDMDALVDSIDEEVLPSSRPDRWGNPAGPERLNGEAPVHVWDARDAKPKTPEELARVQQSWAIANRPASR